MSTSHPVSVQKVDRSGVLATAAGVVVASCGLVGFATLAPAVVAGHDLSLAFDWVPSLGIPISFRLDGLALLFAFLISGIGALVILYAGAYLSGHPRRSRLQHYLILFLGAMLGLVLADDVITLFVFWELTTITSFLLIGFEHDSAKARRSALQALFVTGLGGLVLLAGLLLLADAAGSYQLSAIVESRDALVADPRYLPILALILVGAFTKSAQFPFHFWLPNAMAAPTPVSAYLHSATMVKAGVYLLARLHPALAGTDAWFYALTSFGAVTAVWASLMALRQSDIKLMLAWTTVMALGTLVMFLGAEASVAIAAAITFLLVHALYKCALFLVVGAIDHATGTRDLARLGGLAGAMPITTVAALIAALSMAGFPPFLGFIGKELKYEGALAIAEEPLLIAAAAVAANAMMVSVAGLIGLKSFFGQRGSLPLDPHEVSPALWLGPLILASLGLVFGLMPDLLAAHLIQPAVTSTLGRPETVELALWHGINIPLALSIVTVALGVALFWQHRKVRDALDRLDARLPMRGDRIYDSFLAGLKTIAAWQTGILQHGALSRYTAVVFATFVLAVGAVLVARGGFGGIESTAPAPLLGSSIAVLVAGAACVTMLTQSRLLAICALGVVGAGVAAIFLIYGGVDVAMSQLLVETLLVIILALLLPRLPGLTTTPKRQRWRGIGDGAIAIGCGLVVGVLTYVAAATQQDTFITDFFEAASVPEAFGRNIVNVILVDFRALDTLGEVAVVVVAALAVVALIRLRPTEERGS